MITRESLRILENNLTFTKFVRRDYDDQFAVAGAKIGNVINIRKPPRFVVTSGQGLQLQDVVETSVPLVLTTQGQRSFGFTSADLALSIDDFSKRFVRPAVASMANQIDNDGLALYKSVFNFVGTPGVTPNALLTYGLAGQQLDDAAAPRDNLRSSVITPKMNAVLVDALKGLFQSASKIEEQYDKGTMGETIGFKFSMDQNCNSQTIGGASNILAGTVNATAGQTGSSIVTTGWTHSVNILNQGDIIQFAGVYKVNPQSYAQLTDLANWVVTAAVSSDGAGNATIPIAGPDGSGIIIAGAFQNASAAPGASAIIYIYGSDTATAQYGGVVSPQAVAFHEDAFAIGCADLPLPNGVDMAARMSDKELGLSMRLIRAYDINTDRWPLRMDLLYGWTVLYPQLAARIVG